MKLEDISKRMCKADTSEGQTLDLVRYVSKPYQPHEKGFLSTTRTICSYASRMVFLKRQLTASLTIQKSFPSDPIPPQFPPSPPSPKKGPRQTIAPFRHTLQTYNPNQESKDTLRIILKPSLTQLRPKYNA